MLLRYLIEVLAFGMVSLAESHNVRNRANATLGLMDIKNCDYLHTHVLNCSPWTRKALLTICSEENPYRRTRPLNPECFRLM